MDYMRIAICVSGQFRNAEDVWPKNFDILFEDTTHEYVFFASSWNENPSQVYPFSFLNFLSSLIFRMRISYEKHEHLEIDENLIKELFPNCRGIALARSNSFSLIDGGIRIPQGGRLARKINNSLRMFYQIRLCDSLRVEYEHDNNMVFDCVVRVRFDSALEENPIVRYFDGNSDLYFLRDPLDHKFQFGMVNDQIFFGKSAPMNKLCRAYESIVAQGNNVAWEMDRNEVHEVFVAESALSWYVSTLSGEFEVTSVGKEVRLKRPKRILLKISRAEYVRLVKESPYFFKHFLAKLLKNSWSRRNH